MFDLDEFDPDNLEIVGVFGGYCYLNVSISRIFGVRVPGLTPELVDSSIWGEQPLFFRLTGEARRKLVDPAVDSNLVAATLADAVDHFGVLAELAYYQSHQVGRVWLIL